LVSFILQRADNGTRRQKEIKLDLISVRPVFTAAKAPIACRRVFVPVAFRTVITRDATVNYGNAAGTIPVAKRR